jgi:hypothetical protein
MECIVFGPPLICEKGEFWGRTLGKAYGIKVWCYLEHLGGKHWKQSKKPNNPKKLSPSSKQQQKKNHGSLET